MRVILDMIKQGVKTEVNAAIQEVEVRLEQQEKLNQELVIQELVIQVHSLVNELENLKRGVQGDQEAFPVLPKPQGLCQSSKGQVSLYRSSSSEEKEHESDRKVKELCALGRRVVGFTPIELRGGCTFFVDCRFGLNFGCRLMMKRLKICRLLMKIWPMKSVACRPIGCFLVDL